MKMKAEGRPDAAATGATVLDGDRLEYQSAHDEAALAPLMRARRIITWASKHEASFSDVAAHAIFLHPEWVPLLLDAGWRELLRTVIDSGAAKLL